MNPYLDLAIRDLKAHIDELDRIAMARKTKPKVWATRTARGWSWFVTFPDGDVVACGPWRQAITALDRYLRRTATSFALR